MNFTNAAFLFTPTVLVGSALYYKWKRDQVYTDGAVLTGWEMNTFGPPQYTYVGNSKHIWQGPVSMDQKFEDADDLYFKYETDGGTSTTYSGKGEGKSVYSGTNSYGEKYTKKYWSKGETVFSMKYGNMEKPLHVGVNTVKDQGNEFGTKCEDKWKNCFMTNILKGMHGWQGWGFYGSYSRVYRVHFPNDAKVVVQERKNPSYKDEKYYWMSDKIILEEIPSDKYVEYVKKEWVSFNNGLTEDEKTRILADKKFQ